MTNPYAPPVIDENPELDTPHDYRPTRTLSLAVRALLGAYIVVSILEVGHNVTQLDLFARIKRQSGFTLAEAEASDLRAQLVVALLLVVLLATTITWIVWQTRTSKNARALGTEYMEFGPNAWGWFFCPFINLYRPLVVLRELWRVSDPISPDEEPGFFVAWWLPWVIGGIVANASSRFAGEDADINDLIISIQLNMVATVLLCVSAVFAIKVVAEIHRREQVRVQARGASAKP